MEDILAKLLVADNAIIQQGTNELREAFKTAEVIPALCQVVSSSQNPQIRQYAAVILRKRLTKSRHWMKMSEETRNMVKNGSLKALVSEPEKFVKNSIVQFIGTLVKHEFPNQRWPELLQFIEQLCSTESPADKELAMYTLSIITEVSPDQFLTHSTSIACLFGNMMSAIHDLTSPIIYYTIITMIHLLPVYEGDRAMLSVYQHVLPRVMQAARAFSTIDASKTCDIMELFEDLFEPGISVLLPFMKSVIEMCLEFAVNQSLDESVRVKAINLIGWITRAKKKTIIKNKLVLPILNTMFQLMCSPCDEDDDTSFFGNDESNAPPTVAAQTLDVLALHLPPNKILPALLEHVLPGLQSTNIYWKKASYLALAVVAEGCADVIRTSHLENFLKFICKGITDPEVIVRNAALFALGQFSEFLQPDISRYASELLPVLFKYLECLCVELQQGNKEPVGLDRMFYALEMFCENLDDSLLPYLPNLMEPLFTLLKSKCSVHLRELVISAIGATANAAKSGLIEYFPRIMDSLKVYLTEEQSAETLCLQVQSLDTLGTLARAMGQDHFLPLAEECIQLGLRLISETDDPDIRKAAYGLFASIASVTKENMNPVLPRIVELMLKSLISTDGLVPHFKDENTAFPVYEDDSDTPDEEDIDKETDEEDEDDDDFQDFTAENSYLEEKEEACKALGELAVQTGSAFLPHLQRCFEEVLKLINYPHEDIRKASVETLSQFCINISKIESAEGQNDLLKALTIFIPKCAEIIRMDEDRAVVISALEAYSELLGELKGSVLKGDGHQDAIINCINDIMTQKTACQDNDEEEENNSEDEHSGMQDELLIEAAGEIVPVLGKAMNPDTFAQYFKIMMPFFSSKTVKKTSLAQRSFAVAILADSLEPLGPHVALFAEELLQIFLRMARVNDDEIRNNAVYGIGELARHGKEAVFQHYPLILSMLATVGNGNTHAGTLDNICGALARLIVANINGVPMETVFPEFVKLLPLREDFEENKCVYESLNQLYSLGCSLLINHLEHLLKSSIEVLHKKQGTPETIEMVKNFLKRVERDFPEQFSNTLASIPQEVITAIKLS